MNPNSTSTNIYLEKAPDLLAALKILLEGSKEYTLPDITKVGDSAPNPSYVGLIPWFSLRPNAFVTALCALWTKGCRRFVLVSPTSGLDLPWIKFPAHIRTTFDAAIRVCDKPSWEKLREAIAAPKLPNEWANHRVQEYVEARIIYELLEEFAHGRTSDLSNQFLAPARLLLMENTSLAEGIPDGWRDVWAKFKKQVLEKLSKHVFRLLDNELREVADRITKGLDGTGIIIPADLETLMSVLTQIRVSAGETTRASGSSASPSEDDIVSPSSLKAGETFQVLVVDDHALEWRSVFRKLSEKLKASGKEVSFEFSKDGKTLEDGITRVYFSYYDLVILDVFLGADDGRQTLEILRRDFSQLPVLLWTTSRDQEITTQATLANGILLKKTINWKSLESALSKWIERGHALRTRSLPSPFFNHTITNSKYRQLAVDFHEWCLKQLDSFHALDGEYFRYFTDHGGRHIVKLWELMEQALQPFLQDEEQTVLPKGPNQRELEILGIYLTVICHELGMFPMCIGDKVEDFSKLGKGYLGDVRSLHAVRGMVLLHDSKHSPDGKHIGQYWNDNRGRELGAMLRAEGSHELADRLAVLVGYHARVFKSLSHGEFLEWEKSKQGLDAKFKKLASPVPSLSRTDDAFRSTYLALANVFKETAIRERLRRQCALFRFVDALDITASRNPAEFLVGSGTLPAKQYGENLKRELCRSAMIKNGDVRVEMAVQAPTFAVVKAIIKYVYEKQLMERDDPEKAKKAWTFVQSEYAARTRVKKPWDRADKTKWTIADLQDKSVLLLQKPLDCWLKEVWKLLIEEKGSTELIKHLKKLRILDAKAQEPKLRFEGAEMIASVTALSVAGELLDEYQAIVEAELSDKIRLPDFKSNSGFRWGSAWAKPDPPAGLSTLEKVLPPPQLAL